MYSTYNMQNMLIDYLLLVTVSFPVNSRLMIAKSGESQKLYRCQLCMGSVPLTHILFRGKQFKEYPKQFFKKTGRTSRIENTLIETFLKILNERI